MRPSEHTDAPVPSFAAITLVVASVSLANLATGAIFSFTCAVGSGDDRVWGDYCDTPLPLATVLIGIALPLLGAIIARRARKTWPLGAAAVAGAALALWPWLLLGDPAGNFDGLLT